MPIPKPKDNEEQDEFIARCMSDETMKDEYEDNDQRLAICFSAWRKDKEEDSVNMKIEKRAFPAELRVEGEEKRKIIGHAVVFNKLSEDLGGFREKVLPGAFTNALKDSDVRALWNHDSNIVLGRTKAGTLKLEEDDKGLKVEIDPPSWAEGYMETITRGDVSEMSFAFTVATEEWDDKKKERTIKEVNKLFDVSPVAYPAYPQTSVKVRMDDIDKNDIIEGVGRYLHPDQSEKLDSQGADSDGSGRVGNLDILRKRLDVAER